jgi:hypothetical protein
VNGFASLFHLTNEQKQEFSQQGKKMVNTLIDSLVQNIFEKMMVFYKNNVIFVEKLKCKYGRRFNTNTK